MTTYLYTCFIAVQFESYVAVPSVNACKHMYVDLGCHA
jgi:hypothetical protein